MPLDERSAVSFSPFFSTNLLPLQNSIDVFTDGTSWYVTTFVADAAHTDDID